ncbi:MAG TPA: hypothetical protein VLV30_08350 [Methanomicrobiales archaeon]|nr:hypothetical protein [Methanomicrobiales archaeon]
MTFLSDAVKALGETVHGSGCEDGAATLRRDPDAPRCQFERGATLLASFGGRTAQVVTDSPVQTGTRVSSLFGQELPSPELRTAALGIVNVVAGFLCLGRRYHACDPACHGPCLEELRTEIGGRKVFTPVPVPVISRDPAFQKTGDSGDAGVVVLTGAALIGEEEGDRLGELAAGRGVLLIGPSTEGVASLLGLPHWCPYGR